MGKLASNLVQGLARFTNKSLVKNLIVITLCVMFFFIQLFYPYNYYASGPRNSHSAFQVGIHYVYEQDNLTDIYGQVTQIYDLGFKVIRVNFECDPQFLTDPINQKTDMFFSATSHYGLAVALVIPNDEPTESINFYLNHWGGNLTYVQIMNEPETSSSWDVGALFTDDEILSTFNNIYTTIDSHHLSAQLYTNFGIGYVLRTNVPVEFSQKLNFVGLDVYMNSFLVLSPLFIQNLHEITHKDVVITEFGMSTADSAAQTSYIINGLNLFKSMGLKGCWIVYWNSAYDNYGIRGTPTETAVGDWIAKNAK
ncbi:MAG: hypothetical protein ABSF44_07540 [Candidatus Bathyarchaeia archaeon]|jgi:hypothetical protein